MLILHEKVCSFDSWKAHIDMQEHFEQTLIEEGEECVLEQTRARKGEVVAGKKRGVEIGIQWSGKIIECIA